MLRRTGGLPGDNQFLRFTRLFFIKNRLEYPILLSYLPVVEDIKPE